MIKSPVRGMRDISVADMLIRDYFMQLIEKMAFEAGYQKIETPAVEHLENLTSNNGGENEKLIFKILKRGESFKKALASQTELSDSALRYDLTVPLARYFVANNSDLVLPFKALQIGPVWRADAPQKGRFRQFVQCDMDILGDTSILAEIDILTTVTEILSEICRQAKLSGLTLRLNDRRLLIAVAKYAGFSEEACESVLITLDKRDKIGLPGVKQELLANGLSTSAVEKLVTLFGQLSEAVSVQEFSSLLGAFAPDQPVIDDLETIISTLGASQKNSLKVLFDPTLVRGMGYYTGPVFECTIDGLASSVAGGGRYDKMVGQISGGAEVGACGFSIGFERIMTILDDLKFKIPDNRQKIALLVSPKVATKNYQAIMAQAEELRQSGAVVSVLLMSKNLGWQIKQLEASGYSQFEKIYQDYK